MDKGLIDYLDNGPDGYDYNAVANFLDTAYEDALSMSAEDDNLWDYEDAATYFGQRDLVKVHHFLCCFYGWEPLKEED